MDSLETYLRTNENDHPAILSLANIYYDAEMWGKAEPLYTQYLAKEPQDVDARVDYAFVIAQTTGDFKRAIAEIEKGLKYEPDHVHALFNAGILSLRETTDDKHTSVGAAKEYFLRAKRSALVKDPKMAEQIDQVLEEIRKVEEEHGAKK
jgi:tetratricopeptide (TPR) repeat protein